VSKVKDSLTRKLGPLPIWAWAIIGGGLLYWYRNRTSSASGTGTGSVGPTAATPQPVTTLEPGESAYDPNTGALSTAPGGGGSSDPGNSIDSDGLSTAIGNAIAAAEGNSQVSPINDVAGASPVTPPGAAPAAVKAGAPAGPHGAIYARSGATKPPSRAGFRTVGVGSGRWIYVPVRGKAVQKPKGNAKTGNPATVTKPKTKTRSISTLRNIVGGRTTGRAKPSVSNGRARGLNSVKVATSPTRHRPQTKPIQRSSAVQHPAATHPRVPPKPAPRPAPRPSAPPPRTVRAAPPKPKPKPPAKKR
jgi:hypothetical protein